MEQNTNIEKKDGGNVVIIKRKYEGRGKKKQVWRKRDFFVSSQVVGTGRKPRLESISFSRRLAEYPLIKQFQNIFSGVRFVNPYGAQMLVRDVMESMTKQNFKHENTMVHFLEHVSNAYKFYFLFKYLLDAEEVKMKLDIRMYDLMGVKLGKGTKGMGYEFTLTRINVPGLAEKRPSILRGDVVKAHMDDHSHRILIGYVHFVNLDHILVHFNRKDINEERKFNIEFTFSRTNMRIMRRAISNVDNIRRFLYESKNTLEIEGQKTENLNLFNKTLNEEQIQAVRTISSCEKRNMFIIHGPPGTGKTSTLVEILLQLVLQNSSNFILCCTPTNYTADLICHRLMSCRKEMSDLILRVNSITRNPKDVDPRIRSVTYSYNNGTFDIPPISYMREFRVIVCTCMCAAKFNSMGMNQEFTHVMIDEAGEALIPESLVPLELLNVSNGRGTAVLVGDCNQLGPVIRSDIAAKFGLDISLLEYLSKISSIRSKICHECFLKKTYRSHPIITSLYSSIFYGNTLESQAPTEMRSRFLNFSLFKATCPDNPKPFLMKHVQGEDERDEDSPSWFNMKEVEVVHNTLKIFAVEYRGNYNIGVISPYRKQVQKLRQTILKCPLLKNLRERIDIDTVEKFQGSEKDVILISTVRSNAGNKHFDKKFQLGFLENPKRLNVAISRAKSALIIIGNMKLLYSDKHWSSLIKQSISMMAYMGPPEQELQAFQEQIQTKTGTKEMPNVGEIETDLEKSDLPWRIE